jgi:putative transposon-encoded protein
VAAGVALIVLVALAGGAAWLVSRNTGHSGGPSGSSSAFSSAMKKAGVAAKAPSTPVPLTSVVPKGSHSLDATFTGDELAALMNTFTYEASARGVTVSVSHTALTLGSDGKVSLSGQVAANGNSYAGTVTVPAAYVGGKIVVTGAPTVEAEGFPVGGTQAQQATDVLLQYLNGYLAAAPGLHVDSAEVTADGVHVRGRAPDSISY